MGSLPTLWSAGRQPGQAGPALGALVIIEGWRGGAHERPSCLDGLATNPHVQTEAAGRGGWEGRDPEVQLEGIRRRPHCRPHSGPKVVIWLPRKRQSKVPVAWGRLSTPAPAVELDYLGTAGRQLLGGCGRLEPGARVGFLGNGSGLGWRPSPTEALRVRAPGPEAEARCGPRARPAGGAGVERVARGCSNRCQAFSRPREGCAGGQEGLRGATSLFPPGLRQLWLKRVFPVGLPSRVRPAQPPGTGREKRSSRPGPGRAPRPGAEVDLAGEPESRVPAGAPSLEVLSNCPSPPFRSGGSPAALRQGVLVLYSRGNRGAADCPKAAL